MPLPGRRSIRFRITAVAVIIVAIVLSGAAAALVVAQHGLLVSNVDSTLVQRANDVAALLASDDEVPPELGAGRREAFAQLVDLDGRVLASTPNLDRERPLEIAPGPVRAEVIRTVTGLGAVDGAFRVLSRRLDTPAGPAVLHVGATLDDVDESSEALATSLAVTIPLVVAALGLLVWWLVGRTLAPIEHIREEVVAIGSRELHRRVPEPAGDDEVSRLARTMNDMLDRLQVSNERQLRFVADASHELRSPLTRMRAELEVDLARTGSADERRRLESLLDDVTGLQQLVDDLLHLARTDADVEVARRTPVDLDDIVLREVQRVRAGGRLAVDTSGVSAALVMGDPGQLARAVRNLLDNAERHAASSVSLTLGEVDGHALLAVTDDGPGIPRSQWRRVFERFGRVDGARSRDAGGSGLGLAITRDIVERHGGTVRLEASRDRGARFIVRIPAVGA